MPTIDLNGAINKYAVYNGATDAPLTDPLNNLPDLLWHSDLMFIGAVTTLTGTVDIGGGTWTSIPGDFNGADEKTIVPHGQSYTPLFLGSLSIGGENVPAQGTFYVRPNGHSRGTGCYNIYCDATNIKISRKFLYGLGTPTTTNINYSIDILNVGLDGAGAFSYPASYSGFDATPTRMRCGYFDTDHKHYVETPSGDRGIIQGASLDVAIGRPNFIGGTFRTVGLVYNYGAFLNSYISTIANNTSFQPTVLKVAKK